MIFCRPRDFKSPELRSPRVYLRFIRIGLLALAVFLLAWPPLSRSQELKPNEQSSFYFGVLDFPGAAGVFSYTRLLQVTDIPNQTPYAPEIVSKACDSLRQFLVSEGFFQAQVQPEPQFDETHMLVNVTFHIDLGKRAEVGDLVIEGPPPYEVERLQGDVRSLRARATRASLLPGRTYTRKRIDSGIARMRRGLAGRHYLASRVRFDHPEYREESNRANLIVDAELGPIVNVRVTGATISRLPFLRQRQIRRLIPIFSEGAVDSDLVEEGRRNLVDFFEAKGYFDVKVTANFHIETSKVDLVYNINRGARHRVETVEFEGNDSFARNVLIRHVAVKPHRFLISRGRFSEKLLRQSVNGITTFYRNAGYADVKVATDIVDREPKVYVRFLITEGSQVLVHDLTIEGNSHISTPVLTGKHALRLRPGQPFSPEALADDRSHILAAYFDQGFINSSFDFTIDRLADDPHKVDVTYKISENQQVKVDNLVFAGNKKTRASLIQQEVKIAPDAPLSRTALLESESKLSDLGVFDWQSVDSRRPITDQTNADVLVKLHEAGRNEISYGFGLQVARRGGNVPSGTIVLPGLPPVTSGAPNFTADEKTFVSPRGSITFTRYNLRGLAESASASILIERLDQRAVATYSQPRFAGSDWSSLYSASIERTTENPTFEARLANATWQLEKPLNADKTQRIQVRYSFGRTVLSNLLIPDLVLPQDQRVRLSTVSATWIRDTRDKPLDASRGFYETVDVGITPKALGASANFLRFLGQASYYKSFGPTVWANRITLGLAKEFAGSFVPTSELFFSGGETTLRGFPINGAGPQRVVPACTNPAEPSTCVNLEVPVGGRQLFIVNSEFRFPLGIKEGLGAAVFYDGGNVYGPINISNFAQNYTNTIGVGLRYRTPVGPIRFDVGRNLNPIRGVNATQFYITLGQAF